MAMLTVGQVLVLQFSTCIDLCDYMTRCIDLQPLHRTASQELDTRNFAESNNPRSPLSRCETKNSTACIFYGAASNFLCNVHLILKGSFTKRYIYLFCIIPMMLAITFMLH